MNRDSTSIHPRPICRPKFPQFPPFVNSYSQMPQGCRGVASKHRVVIPSLTSVHFLITYGCAAECDHCFVWGSPKRDAHMTIAQVDAFLDEITSLQGVTAVCAEGGEPFLHYDVLRHFLSATKERGLSASALTNAFWVESKPQAAERVAELQSLGLKRLGISADEWHQQAIPAHRVELLLEVCQEAGLEASRMECSPERVIFRGRAAERLAPLAPGQPPEGFTACPREKLDAPTRVHLDCYGRLHLCQGLCFGEGSIADVLASYDPATHPVVARLLSGGPIALAQLAAEQGFRLQPGYADACHLCYRVREYLRPQFSDLLGPDEMYGG